MVERRGDDPLSRIRDRTPVLRSYATSDERPLDGTTVGVASHLEPKTGVFVETLRDAGATVRCTTSNARSVHGDVVAHLDDQPGIEAFAAEGMSDADVDAAQRDLLATDPDVLVTDGAELLAKRYADPEGPPDGLLGCAEQTTSGVSRLRAMAASGALDVPVYAVNHTPMKHWFDNVHGTGESALTNLAVTSNAMLSGRTVVVAGYGYVGRGIATKARAVGATTVVTEIDPRKAMRAHVDGHRVMPMDEAAGIGDVFVTATGNCHVVREEHFERMGDGAVLCNAGHRDVEIDVDGLAALAASVDDREAGVTRYTLPDGRRLDLLTEGDLVNLTGPASQGHPAGVMDSTFATLFVAVRELADGPTPDPGVHPLPERLDREVAERKLKALGIDIDSPTRRQRAYLAAWRREDVA